MIVFWSVTVKLLWACTVFKTLPCWWLSVILCWWIRIKWICSFCVIKDCCLPANSEYQSFFEHKRNKEASKECQHKTALLCENKKIKGNVEMNCLFQASPQTKNADFHTILVWSEVNGCLEDRKILPMLWKTFCKYVKYMQSVFNSLNLTNLPVPQVL